MNFVEDTKNLVISLTQTTSRDELLFLFQLIDEGNRVDISEMENRSTQKSLKKLFKEHWKLSKNRDGYVKKKKCKKAPLSCRDWYLCLLQENGILPTVPQMSQIVPPPPPKTESIGPSFSLKGTKSGSFEGRNRMKSLMELHKEKMSKGQTDREKRSLELPKYSENRYNPEKILKRRQELKREELGRMTKEERERMKKSGYLTFSKSQVSGSSRIENEEKIEQYKTSIKNSFRSSRY